MPCAMTAILFPESRARVRLPYAESLVSGVLLGVCEGVCARAVPVYGVHKCGLGTRRESGQQRGCGETVPSTAGGGVRWSGPPCSGADAWGRCTGGRVGGWATRCPPAVRGRSCVDAWAGAASGGSFRAVAPVVVWGMARLLRGGRVLYRRVPNNACSQGSQELNASAGAC